MRFALRAQGGGPAAGGARLPVSRDGLGRAERAPARPSLRPRAVGADGLCAGKALAQACESLQENSVDFAQHGPGEDVYKKKYGDCYPEEEEDVFEEDFDF